MAIRCAQCGEELLGAVNRCWRCGASVLSRTGDANLPPIRRAPIRIPEASPAIEDESGLVTAELANQVAPNLAQGERPPLPGIAIDRQAGQSAVAGPVLARRAGCPFAEPPHKPAARGRFSRSWSDAAALVGLLLGLFSLGASFFTVWAVIPAVFGLGAGLVGLSSAQRGTAIIAILLSCLALLVGSFFGLTDWYESRYGYKPWDAPAGWEE